MLRFMFRESKNVKFSLGSLPSVACTMYICDVNDLVKLKMLSKDIHYCWLLVERTENRCVCGRKEYANKL